MQSSPAATYDEIALDYLQEYGNPSEHIDSFVEALPQKAHVLDLGCGPGVDAAYLNTHGFQVQAIDASSKMIQLAQAKAPHAQFAICDMRDFDYGIECYDGILASYSLIHIPKQDTGPVLHKIIGSLKPQGLLCLGLQMGESQELEIDEPFNPALKLFLNIFSYEEIHLLLKLHNLVLLAEHLRPSQTAEELNFTKYCAIMRKP